MKIAQVNKKFLMAGLVLATIYSQGSFAGCPDWLPQGVREICVARSVRTYYRGYVQKNLSTADLAPNLTFRGPLTQTDSRDAFLKASAPVYQIFRGIQNMRSRFEADGSMTTQYDFVARTCPDRDVVTPMEEHLTVGPDGIRKIEVKYDVGQLFPCGMPH